MKENTKVNDLLKDNDDLINLRFNFIGMVFALAIAQVGIEFGDFFLTEHSMTDHLYIISHLFLAVFIIASSWIGWQNSKSLGNRMGLRSLFSIPFIILLVDLFLVILYFLLVKTVEKEVDGGYQPSALPEAKLSVVIFATYLVWDILTRLLIIDVNNWIFKIELKKWWDRGWQTILCLALSLVIWIFMAVEESQDKVVLIDFALLFVFALFRGLKSRDVFAIDVPKILFAKVVIYIGIPMLGIVFTTYRIFYS